MGMENHAVPVRPVGLSGNLVHSEKEAAAEPVLSMRRGSTDQARRGGSPGPHWTATAKRGRRGILMFQFYHVPPCHFEEN